MAGNASEWCDLMMLAGQAAETPHRPTFLTPPANAYVSREHPPYGRVMSAERAQSAPAHFRGHGEQLAPTGTGRSPFAYKANAFPRAPFPERSEHPTPIGTVPYQAARAARSTDPTVPRTCTAWTNDAAPDMLIQSPPQTVSERTEGPANTAGVATALASAIQQALQAVRPPGPRINMPVPTYSGCSDQTSANAFLVALNRYRQATGCSDSDVLSRILPAALVGDAARWHRLVGCTAATWDEFQAAFREEFLPYDYQPRMRRELELRTQAPDEPLLEYVRAMQELYEYADPEASNAERVERVIRQSHPTFALYLRGCSCRNLNELATEARKVQAAIAASRAYRPPPPPGESLEPSCAWHGGALLGQADRDIREQQTRLSLSDRALHPYPSGLRSAESGSPDSSRALINGSNRPLRQLPAPPTTAPNDAGAGPNGRRPPRREIRCYDCGQPGHIARLCQSGQGNEAGRR